MCACVKAPCTQCEGESASTNFIFRAPGAESAASPEYMKYAAWLVAAVMLFLVLRAVRS